MHHRLLGATGTKKQILETREVFWLTGWSKKHRGSINVKESYPNVNFVIV